MVAGERGLIEDGLVAADEGPVGGVDDGTQVVLNGQAHVEHLKSHHLMPWFAAT